MIEKMREALRSLIFDELGPVDTWAMYPGTVVACTAGSPTLLDVKLNDQRFGPGMQKVPLRTGLPGVAVDVPSGARVLVGFDSGRRDHPIAHLWESGTPVTLRFDAATSVTVEAPAIKLGAGALQGVARLGDTAGPYAITSASTKVLAE